MSIWSQLNVIDSHTGGEPTRVVVDGFPEALKGMSVSGARQLLEEEYDWIRSGAVNEPRGSDAVVGALLLPSTSEDCDVGVVFFNNAGYLGMCVHGTVGLAATLRHLGRAKPGDSLRIDTPVGIVVATLAEDEEDGEVTVDNVHSYRTRANVSVHVDGYGEVIGDVAWGGNWFFLAQEHPVVVKLDQVKELTDFSWAVRRALTRDGVTGENGVEIDHIEVFAPPQPGIEADSQNFVLCPGGAYDRSPCGTGTSAKLACLHAAGKLKEGEIWKQAGIVGSIFRGAVRLSEQGDLIPSITGAAHITGESRLLFDPEDPFRNGIF